MTQLLTVAMGFSDSGEIPYHAQVNHHVPDEQLPFMVGKTTFSDTTQICFAVGFFFIYIPLLIYP